MKRVCLICQHFSLDLGHSGFSEATPGVSAQMDCDKRGQRGCAWPKHTADEGSVDLPPLITRAETCKLFEPHEALIHPS